MPTTARAQLRDGSQVLLRPIAADDKDRLARGFERLSEDSRYRRFFTALPRLSPNQLAYLTEVDHSDHEAIVALAPGGEELLGVARYVRPERGSEEAEAAITVADDLHGRGLGRALLERLVERAREEDVRRFTALIQADNVAAIRTLTALGETARSGSGSEIELVIELPPERGLSAGLERALHAAAAGSITTVGALARRAADAARPLSARSRPAPRIGGAIETVVAGSDGSGEAEQAVREAAELVAALGARLHVVSVDAGLQREQADEAVASAVELARSVGAPAEAHVRAGEPAGALISAAEELRADLLVVGSRGMRGARRYLLGSVPNKVTHHAPCSVLVVRTR